MKTEKTSVPYKVVPLSSIPRSGTGIAQRSSSRYIEAITAASTYKKRAVLLTLPEIKTRKQALNVRYAIQSALKSRNLQHTLRVVQRNAQLFLCKNTKTGAKTSTKTLTA